MQAGRRLKADPEAGGQLAGQEQDSALVSAEGE